MGWIDMVLALENAPMFGVEASDSQAMPSDVVSSTGWISGLSWRLQIIRPKKWDEIFWIFSQSVFCVLAYEVLLQTSQSSYEVRGRVGPQHPSQCSSLRHDVLLQVWCRTYNYHYNPRYHLKPNFLLWLYWFFQSISPFGYNMRNFFRRWKFHYSCWICHLTFLNNALLQFSLLEDRPEFHHKWISSFSNVDEATYKALERILRILLCMHL